MNTKTMYVPEDCCFKSVDDSMKIFPDDAVCMLVDRYPYELALMALTDAEQCLDYASTIYPLNGAIDVGRLKARKALDLLKRGKDA